MQSVRHLIHQAGSIAKSIVLPSPDDDLLTRLDQANIPITSDPCRACPDPCPQDYGDPELGFHHEPWPTKFFDVDTVSDMLGRVKPYHRQVVISTGKSDWAKEVTEANGTLATYLSDVQSQLSSSTPKSSASSAAKKKSSGVPGVFDSEGNDNLMILNGSHRSPGKETVLVFPDYKMVTGVDTSLAGAESLWKGALDPSLGKTGVAASGLKSWVIPFNSVILLCSHKRRDNRCAIAAPVLRRALTASLESLGWEVCDQLDDPDECSEPALEDIPGTDAEREAEMDERLKSLVPTSAASTDTKRALILYCSHIGGHKYAGNVIIYNPQGSGVWYGRVSTHEVAAVTKTITEGKVYPALLRGGVNLTRPKGKTLMDW